MNIGQVMHQKHDADGNPIGKFSQNPILHTCLYVVEFSEVDILELSASIIAQSIYVQCNVDRT